MNDNDTIMLKLYNGDYIIGEYNASLTDENTIYLQNPRAFVFMPTMSGTMKAGFQPICIFSKKSNDRISLNRAQIMVIVENVDIPKEIENGYKSEISGISIANATDIAAVNKSKDTKPGEFIL